MKAAPAALRKGNPPAFTALAAEKRPKAADFVPRKGNSPAFIALAAEKRPKAAPAVLRKGNPPEFIALAATATGIRNKPTRNHKYAKTLKPADRRKKFFRFTGLVSGKTSHVCGVPSQTHDGH